VLGGLELYDISEELKHGEPIDPIAFIRRIVVVTIDWPYSSFPNNGRTNFQWARPSSL